MKKYLIIFAVVLVSNSLNAQAFQMKTQLFSYKADVLEWSEWEQMDALAVLSAEKKQLVIYEGSDKRVYRLVGTMDEDENKFWVNSIDEQGDECLIKISLGRNDTPNILTLDYPNFKMAMTFVEP